MDGRTLSACDPISVTGYWNTFRLACHSVVSSAEIFTDKCESCCNEISVLNEQVYLETEL